MVFAEKQSQSESKTDLTLLTSENTPQTYNSTLEAIQAGVMNSESGQAALKAERDCAVARQRFVDKFNAIKHEKVSHASKNLSEVVTEADKALADYDARTTHVNQLLGQFGIKERSPEDKTLVDDFKLRVKLDEEISSLKLESVRHEISRMTDGDNKSELKLASDEDAVA